MPEDWPDYPRHEQIAAYFQGFAEDNHLLERITFRTRGDTMAQVVEWFADPRYRG
jgi:hypothetical protein